MKEIRITVRNKIAMNLKNDTYVCDNSDYRVVFDFDAEWEEHPVKTARFKYNGTYQEAVFTGSVCDMPVIRDARLISIGVYAGNLQTSTPAVVHASQSILSGDAAHEEPEEDVYHQLVELVESGVLQGPDGKSAYDLAVENGYIGSETDWLSSLHGAPGKTPEYGVDYGTQEQIADIANQAAGILADDIREISDGKVDKVDGKGLSTNDYDNAAKKKVDAIPENPKYTDTVTIVDASLTKDGDAADAKVTGEKLNRLKDELSDLSPAGAAVGQLFRVAAISEDGKYTMEPVDMLDVQVDGKSIVADGVANVPVALSNRHGVVKTTSNSGIYINTDGVLLISRASDARISDRSSIYLPIVPSNLDYAVKAAMCDGKGAVWTAEEQAAARERMGIPGDYELIADVTTEEETEQLYIDKDNDGTDLMLVKAIMFIELPKYDGSLRQLYISTCFYSMNEKGVSKRSSSANTLFSITYKTYARTEIDLTGGILSANQYGIRSDIKTSSNFGSNFGYDYDYSGTLLYVHKIGYERYNANSPIIPAGTRVKLYGVRA